eukprot:CAMPEP_0182423108 /NCGR_PEP_ID=MMETSP1167-20130531/8991_1 /TAXON_ID=2988 /ORGANISM="Mallomonas Sp, Strain CCMP3275" /LENGTH=888 /DNA_ID=CAMNT_0024601775 /DNA_START=434 /DNA_END=3097 /DNA_ORIENTATION=+
MKYDCPAGTFGDQEGLSSEKCSGECPEGYSCPTGTVFAHSHQCGNNSFYCPAGSAFPVPVPEGYYSTGVKGRRSAVARCPPGSFCVSGERHLCAGGVYGSTHALTTPHCSGFCPAGWYCPVGSVHSMKHPCSKSPTEHCPEGSSHPLPVPSGHYAIRHTVSVSEEGGYHGVEECPAGSYCISGERLPCPGGRFGSGTGEVNQSCSGECAPGHFCPPGSISPLHSKCGTTDLFCPRGSASPTRVSPGYYTTGGEERERLSPRQEHDLTRSSQKQCEPGFYCLSDGVRRVCPAGWFGSASGLSRSSCSGLCLQGFYCPEGSDSSQQMMCGDEGRFCPPGSPSPQVVHPGYYSAGGNESTRHLQRKCPPGSYCVNGRRLLCPPGVFGGEFGLMLANCSGLCAEGHYCPEGSARETEVQCGDPSRYCPGGGGEPLSVPEGHYSVGGNESTGTGYLMAPPGYYALDGVLYACPAGRYGAIYGLRSSVCSGECVEGFYCPVASVSPYMFGCGPSSLYCPRASPAPVKVLSGRYTVDWSEPCPAGYYRNFTESVDPSSPGFSSLLNTRRSTPVCFPCPSNTYKSRRGDSFSLCVSCDSYAAAEAGQATCVCYGETGGDMSALEGREGRERRVLYFNVTSNTCEAVSEQEFIQMNELYIHTYNLRERPHRDNLTITQHEQWDCPPGFFCQDGVRWPCERGRFGGLWRETRPECEGECAPGYYCPQSSTNATAKECGGPHLYCPAGSWTPLEVPPGYYSDLSTAAPTVRHSILPCPPGHWCSAGVKRPCAAGRYGSSARLSSRECDGLCLPGHFCPEASISAAERVCGNSSVYCPRGSPVPRRVHSGFYGAFSGPGAGSDRLWSTDNSTYSVELPCEPGYYCTAGVKYPCAPGRFNW